MACRVSWLLVSLSIAQSDLWLDLLECPILNKISLRTMGDFTLFGKYPYSSSRIDGLIVPDGNLFPPEHFVTHRLNTRGSIKDVHIFDFVCISASFLLNKC